MLGIEKLDPGPPVPGTRYREVVQMLPLVRGEIRSRITRIEPGLWLEEDFEGAAMRGHLAYQFLDVGNGTRLIQHEIPCRAGTPQSVGTNYSKDALPALAGSSRGYQAAVGKPGIRYQIIWPVESSETFLTRAWTLNDIIHQTDQPGP